MNGKPTQVVVAFPKAKAAGGPKTDEELTKDVRRAWRRLRRAISAAEYAGLHVEADFNPNRVPTITREL